MGGLAPDLQQKSMWCLKKSKRLREGLKKGGWVGLAPDQFFVNFSSSFFFEKNISLRHLILPKNHFKTNLFFSIFGGGDPPPVRSW